MVGSIVFEVLFFSSKWNEAGKSIEINADFRVSYKKYGAASTIHSIIAERFAKDIDGACQYLLEEVFDDYNVTLDFLDEMLGTDRIMYRIREISYRD